MPIPEKSEIDTGSDSLQEAHASLEGTQRSYDTVIAYQEDNASNGNPADLVFGSDTSHAVTVPPGGQVVVTNLNTQKAIQAINTNAGSNFSSLHVSAQSS